MEKQRVLDDIFDLTQWGHLDDYYSKFCIDYVSPKINGGHVLEMSTSIYSSVELAKRADTLVVIDGSLKKIDLLNEKNISNVEGIHCLFEQFCTLRNFDTICMFHALEHVEDSTQVLKLIHGWLSDSGTFFVSVPNAESIHRRLGVELGLIPDVYTFSQSDYDKGHKRIYNYMSLIGELTWCGFDIVDVRGSFIKVLPDATLVSCGAFTPEVLDGLFKLSKDVPADLCAELIVTCRKSKNV